MKFDDRIEAELGPVFAEIQLAESALFARAESVARVQTRAPFVNARTRAIEYFVMLHGVDAAAPATRARGGLSPWQIRRAKHLMAVHRSPALSIADIASACGLTESHFVREFKQSTGVTPHRWAMLQRVDTARRLLLHTRLSLERVAAGSGFFDPSHLTRWFRRLTGQSPRAWQKAEAEIQQAAQQEEG